MVHQLKIYYSKTMSGVIIDYCGIIQNIEEQFGWIFIIDIYMKIFVDKYWISMINIVIIFCFKGICKISSNENKI